MPSSYTSLNRFELQNPGEGLNTWGSKLNSDAIALIDFSLSGVTALTPSGAVTLTSANGATDQARAAILNLTSGTGGTITIPAVSHVYQVRNNCSGNAVLTTGSGTTATVEPGSAATVICDGTNCYRFADAADIAACLASANAYANSLAFSGSSGQLPGQSGNAGNFLTTNGSVANWGPVMVAGTGDATFNGSSAASSAITLATVNSNVGSFTNASITVDAKGRITAAATGSATTVQTALITNQQTNGSSLGSTSVGAWSSRSLTTVVQNSITGASVSSPQITLPAGTFEIFAQQSIASTTGSSAVAKARWRNATDSTTAISGLNCFVGAGLPTPVILQGQFTIGGTKSFTLDAFVAVANAGTNIGSGEVEVYVSIYLRKIA